jgi:leucyl/phenylalanyl-tRNA--protein transferase
MPGRQPPTPPDEPPRTGWRLPDLRQLGPEDAGHDLLAVGADLAPGTLLAAYRSGLFPMHVAIPTGNDSRCAGPDDEASDDGSADPQIGWWSPDPRGVLPLGDLRISRSLRRSMLRYRCTIDEAFDEVVAGCADRGRPDGWINPDIATAYRALHELGWAHSVEVWQDGRLAGGLYGVAIDGLFAGESMFHRSRDASKTALVHLVRELSADGTDRLLDVQWLTPHLASLGAIAIPRGAYRRRLDAALRLPPPARWRVPTEQA